MLLVKRTLHLLLNATHIRVIVVHSPIIYGCGMSPGIGTRYASPCRHIILSQTAFCSLDSSLGSGFDLAIEIGVQWIHFMITWWVY